MNIGFWIDIGSYGHWLIWTFLVRCTLGLVGTLVLVGTLHTGHMVFIRVVNISFG